MLRLNLVVLATALLATSAGCAADPMLSGRVASTTPMYQSDAIPRAAAPAPRLDTSSPTSGSVHIDEKIIKACGDLPIARFAFDSARVEGEAATALDALGRCFSVGPLRGRSMKVIGHTDPRGETEYNLALGQRRAGSVAGYLSSHGGVDRSHVAPSSRGEFDATGVDEEGWARDRKVNVFLVE